MLLCVVAVIAVAAITAFSIHGHIENKKELEQERIEAAYLSLNYALGATPVKIGPLIDQYYLSYRPLESDEYNEYGVNFSIYMYLKFYEQQTGNVLPYGLIADYLSTEYEPDGSLRLYNNGLHPEIQAYVDWAWGKMPEMEQYIDSIENVYADYTFDNKNEWPSPPNIVNLSPQMLDELAKKVDDPAYDMDLISLQKQGY